MISMIEMMVHGEGTEGVGQAWQRRWQGFGVEVAEDMAVVGYLGQRHGAEAKELWQELRKMWMEVGLYISSGIGFCCLLLM
jgi:hypothetical protein